MEAREEAGGGTVAQGNPFSLEKMEGFLAGTLAAGDALEVR